MKELDADYVFSVENLEEDSIECPLCGTNHENSIVSRSSILADKQQAFNQLENIKKQLQSIENKMEKIELNSIKVNSKIDEINSKYTINDNWTKIPLNEVIENFAYQSINRNINITKKEKAGMVLLFCFIPIFALN